MKPHTLALDRATVAGRVGMVRSRLMRVASALAAIAVVCCISPPGAEADALPPGYPAYIPVDQYYASQGVGLISATVVFNEIFTGTDSNGGYVEGETTWGTVYSEGTTIEDGGYSTNGYINAGLPFGMPSWNLGNGLFSLAVSNDPTLNLFFGLPLGEPLGSFPSKPQGLLNLANDAGNVLGKLGTFLNSGGPQACTSAAVIGCLGGIFLFPPAAEVSCAAVPGAAAFCNQAGQIAAITGGLLNGVAGDPIDTNY